MSFLVHQIKKAAINIAGIIAQFLPQGRFTLAVSYPLQIPFSELQRKFATLDPATKNTAYRLRWEMAKMEDPRISGLRWGEENFWKEPSKVARVLQRLQLFGQEHIKTISYNLRYLGGHARSHASYFSIEEKAGCDPQSGWIGYVNGLRTDVWKAGRDAWHLSETLANGNNIHCVHCPSRQDRPSGDFWGLIFDTVRHLAIEGGAHTRASCLIAQQWIDFLIDHPTKSFLQTCHSDGATQVRAALDILRKTRPDLISRLRIVTFAPAHIIKPLKNEPLEVINLIKEEDWVVNPWGTGYHLLKAPCRHIQVLKHNRQNNPHNFRDNDYLIAAKCYVDEFMRTGHIFPCTT